METKLIEPTIDINQINIEISALERMCLFYGDIIEKYQDLDPPVPETLDWLYKRNAELGGKMIQLMEQKEKLGLKP